MTIKTLQEARPVDSEYMKEGETAAEEKGEN